MSQSSKPEGHIFALHFFAFTTNREVRPSKFWRFPQGRESNGDAVEELLSEFHQLFGIGMIQSEVVPLVGIFSGVLELLVFISIADVAPVFTPQRILLESRVAVFCPFVLGMRRRMPRRRRVRE